MIALINHKYRAHNILHILDKIYLAEIWDDVIKLLVEIIRKILYHFTNHTISPTLSEIIRPIKSLTDDRQTETGNLFSHTLMVMKRRENMKPVAFRRMDISLWSESKNQKIRTWWSYALKIQPTLLTRRILPSPIAAYSLFLI